MARVHPSHVEALVRHFHHTERSSDSDIEFVSQETGVPLQFNPLGPAVSQFLCKKLELQNSGTSVRVDNGLGAPCKILETLGDGNCFFRALSQAVCGTDQYHETIREAVVTQLESHAAAYETILRTGYESVSDYISESNMRSQGIWATEVEIQAAADFFGVSIYTYYQDRWIEYSSKRGQVSNQGIYLENRGGHYRRVVCVKRPQTQSCYKYCEMDMSGKSLTFSPLPPESADHESDAGLAENDYENDHNEDDWAYWNHCEEDWAYSGNLNEDEDHESNGNFAEGQENEIDNNLTEEEETEIDDNLDEEEDYESHRDLAKQDAEQERQIKENLYWSVLNTSWNDSLEWLGDRWWGKVSEDEIRSFMDEPERRPGDIVIAEPLGNTPGGVCSITMMTENSVLTTDVAVGGGFYTITKLNEGEFSDLTKVIRYLVRDMKRVHLQRRLKTIPSKSGYFSATHVATELCFMMNLPVRIFWGTYESVESQSYRKMLRYLQMTKRRFGNQAYNASAIVHCTTDVSLGYLFEVINDQGRKIKVTFDKCGFAFGTSSRFYQLLSLLSYLTKVEELMFAKVPSFWDAVKSPEMMENE